MNFYVIDFCDVYTQQCGSLNYRNTPYLLKYPKIKKINDVFVYVSFNHVSTFKVMGYKKRKEKHDRQLLHHIMTRPHIQRGPRNFSGRVGGTSVNKKSNSINSVQVKKKKKKKKKKNPPKNQQESHSSIKILISRGGGWCYILLHHSFDFYTFPMSKKPVS